MNAIIDDLFKDEEERLFKPGPNFTHRVMLRLGQQQAATSQTFWDSVLAVRRPVVATAIATFVLIATIQVLMPAIPSRGPVQWYLEADISGAETFLYQPVQIPRPTEIVENLIFKDDE